MNRARAVVHARVGAVAIVVLLVALVAARIAGYGSWATATFPLWGPPAAYVVFVLALWALAIVVAVLFVLLRPWLRW